MKENKIPAKYQTVMPYLIIENAAGFMEFMKKVFNGEELMNEKRNETLIMHAEIKVGDSTIMFADSTEQFQPQPAGMFIYVDDADKTYNTAIAEGATSIMEPANQSYGISGGVKDPFGNVWWITSLQS